MKTSIDRALDSQHVKRWSLVATTAESNVASHSFNVAVIAMAIYQILPGATPFGAHSVCYYATLHDIDEVFTGDIPTPTKIAMRAAGIEPSKLFEGQEASISMPPEMKALLKIADLIDNWHFIDQHGAGVRARIAADEVRGRLDAAIDAASSDLQTASRWVLDYVENRRSEEGDRRKGSREGVDGSRSTNGSA